MVGNDKEGVAAAAPAPVAAGVVGAVSAMIALSLGAASENRRLVKRNELPLSRDTKASREKAGLGMIIEV